jgi:DNA polymerase-3 subunit beta
MGIDDGEKTFNIKTANSFFSLNIFPAEEYPALPEGIKTINLLREDKNRDRDALFLFSLQAAVFREAVKQSVYATAPQDSRPFLSSILWEFDEGNLRMVATDINRLVIKDLSIKCSSKNSFLVPVKALKEITTILENDDEQIDFLLVNKQLYAVSRGVVFYTRLINAQFPRYEQVIPKEFDGQVAFER